MRKSKLWLLLILIIPCALLFSACSLDLLSSTEKEKDKNYVVSIEKSTSTETTDTYLVTYLDNSTSLITIENGEDGEDGLDGQNLTLEELKKYCEEKGISLDDFIAEHISIEYTKQENTISSASLKALKSTVSVWCEFPSTSGTARSGGAGIIYKMEEEYTYIITNQHVVYYSYSTTTNKIATKITVFTYGSQERVGVSTDEHGNKTYVYGYGAIECSYVGGVINYDIAVLKCKTADIKKFQPSACAVTVANGYSVADTAIAIGNPEGEGTSVTTGIVSKYSEDLTITGADDVTVIEPRVIRIDTAINSGNSGGGVFNIEGNLIGIVHAKITDTEIENIAYALPIDNVTKVADNLIYYYKQTNSPSSVKKLMLGITYTPSNQRSEFIETEDSTKVKLYDDCVIVEVSEDGLAHKMGMQVDDIVLNATIIRNGVSSNYTFSQAHEFSDLLLTIRTGDELLLKVKRGDVIESLTSQTITDSMLTVIE